MWKEFIEVVSIVALCIEFAILILIVTLNVILYRILLDYDYNFRINIYAHTLQESNIFFIIFDIIDSL